MIYINPNNVTSPKDLIRNIRVILDQGENSFSLARLNWNGKECIGIRWNISQREWDNPNKENNSVICVGMPVSRGHATWFILPKEFEPFVMEYITQISKESK